MPNRSHFNKGHIAINSQNKNGIKHSSAVNISKEATKTVHFVFIKDAVEALKQIPDSSIQLILVDPPYNLDLAYWDRFDNYLAWAKTWIDEIYRVLSDSGNCVIFGGFQYQDLKKGDLLEILSYTRHSTQLRFVNLIIWHYKNGMSAHRFFANRHEEAVWLSKTKKYYFDLDSVRTPYDDATKELYKKDKRLNPDTIDKGKNPTNVWEINRLNANAKERVGHPTQKPIEIVRRFVRGLSFPGSTVLDFFAGSGTTGRVCIEEGRNSILVDNDSKMNEYLQSHISKIGNDKIIKPYSILKNANIIEAMKTIQNINSCEIASTEQNKAASSAKAIGLPA